jgi:drug/metabolite transporter (DMT)-like permease
VRRAMLDFDPQIVHFCGHGSGAKGIAFERSNGTAKLVNSDALAGFFELFSERVKYVVLNACYSETQAKAIVRSIDYVIGMKKEIGDTSAIEFAVALYDALGAGKNIEFAFKLACNSLMWTDVPEHLTPTILVREKRNDDVQLVLHEEESIKTIEGVQSESLYRHMDSELEHVSKIKEIDGNQKRIRQPLYFGIGLALAAALFWGIGNSITRWSAVKDQNTSFDIALLKYLVAGFFLILCGLLMKNISGEKFSFSRFRNSINISNLIFASLAKGSNLYSWILAVTMTSAGIVATLENLHVMWTVAVLVLSGKKMPRGFFISSVVIIIGVTLISGIAIKGINNSFGLALGVIAGISFSVFGILWAKNTRHPKSLWGRSIEMGILLILSGVIMYPVHLIVNEIWLKGARLPFVEINSVDIGIQAINGLVGIGVTYFLMNESLVFLRKAERFPSLFLGLALSFVVPITMLSELAIFGLRVEIYQWLGVLLFVCGYTYMRGSILNPEN